MGVSPPLLVPDGVGVGLKLTVQPVYSLPFQNETTVLGFQWYGSAVSGLEVLMPSPLIGGRVEHLFRLQEFGDLHRPPAFHTQLKDALDHRRGCSIHDPLCSIRAFAVTKRTLVVSGIPLLALGLLYRTDFAAGGSLAKLIEPVF